MHNASGYVAPFHILAGREKAIFAARNLKLAAARERRVRKRCDVALPSASSPKHREWLAEAGTTTIEAIYAVESRPEFYESLLIKTFDILADELISKNFPGDKTPLELFLDGIRDWEAGLRRRMEDEKPVAY
jgi:hypothetical protein